MKSVPSKLAFLAAASLALAACSNGGVTPKKSSANASSPSPSDPSDDKEQDAADHPAQVSGAFLFDCAWGDKVDDSHVQVACSARKGSTLALDDTSVTWQAVDANGSTVDAQQTAKPVDGVDVVFALPADVVPGATVVAHGATDARVVLADHLTGLKDPSVVACLMTEKAASCVAQYLNPLTILTGYFGNLAKAGAEAILGGGQSYAGGTALTALTTTGKVVGGGKVLGFGAATICGENGLKDGTLPGLGGLVVGPTAEKRQLSFGGSSPTCFAPFDPVTPFAPGVLRFSPSVTGGPADPAGEPYCYFVWVGTSSADTELLVIENPKLFPASGAPALDVKDLVATADAHPCQ